MMHVGLVLGTKPSNPLEFWVGVSADQYLELDDVVVLRSELPTGQNMTFYGLVHTVEKSFEGLDFDSDNQLVQEGILPVSLSHIAQVMITRIEPEIFVPPHPGQPVYRAENKDFEEALFFDRMDYKIPAGLMRNGKTAVLNYEFINGAKGAHISISGISGVATKTSYALFLLHGLFHSPTLKAEHKNNSRALLFNVKGEDLFFIDKPNAKLSEQDKITYDKLGLPVTPFKDVSFFAPSRSASGELIPDTESRSAGVQAYGWNLWDIANQGLFRFLFVEDSEAMNQLSFLIERMNQHLYDLSSRCRPPSVIDMDGTKLSTLRDLGKHLQDIVEGYEEYERHRWFGRNTPRNTISAFLRRFEAVVSHLSPLIRSDITTEHHIAWHTQKVTLIDINKLHSRAKMFVVGATLRQLFTEKEAQGPKPTVFVVLDELNRYAARDRWSPIKDILLDIAERGRSLGIILIGAQQTASEIERRIIANAAIRVNGRLDAAEASHKEYEHLTGTFRKRSLMIKPGTMIVHQPELASPVLVSYPFSAWATRKEEVDTLQEGSLEASVFDDF